MRLLKNILFMAAFAATAAAGACSPSKVVSVPSSAFEEAISASPDIQLVDVRSAEEYGEGHIAGSVNINVQSPGFKEKAIAELDKARPVYVYCRSGRRSLTAAEILSDNGFTVYNLEKGILGWEADGLPVVTE